MSLSVGNIPKEQRPGQHINNAVSDDCSTQPALPSIELDSTDEKAVAGERKRSSPLAMASYNSEFLEGLFDDIANSSLVSVEDHGDNQDDSTPTTNTGIAKRRRVSTNKSLGRCAKSHANLAAAPSSDVVDLSQGTTNKSLVLLSDEGSPTKTRSTNEFPATVSVSHSFQGDLVVQGRQAIPEEDQNHPNQQGDFGWFIDMDDHQDFGGGGFPQSSIGLAFSVPVAPLALCRDLQAEVEWAQAADTVDEVLGDLF